MTMPHPKSPPIFPYPWASDWGEDQYGLWMGLDYKGVHIVFRWIEPGTFMMGSPENEEGRKVGELLHKVTLTKGFWFSETMVTQELWEAVMGDNPSLEVGKKLPVHNIGHSECVDFFEKMRVFHDDLQLRFPWEAEWEYACRAATNTAYNFGENCDIALVNYRGASKPGDDFTRDSKRKVVSVKSYPCNNWGLYEMHGNVSEWCHDHYLENLGREDVVDPFHLIKEGDVNTCWLARGGEFTSLDNYVRSASRLSVNGFHGHPKYTGLRLVVGVFAGYWADEGADIFDLD